MQNKKQYIFTLDDEQYQCFEIGEDSERDYWPHIVSLKINAIPAHQKSIIKTFFKRYRIRYVNDWPMGKFIASLIKKSDNGTLILNPRKKDKNAEEEAKKQSLGTEIESK